MFLVKFILKICSKFTREHPCRCVFSIKLLLKSNLGMGVILQVCCIFSEHLLTRTPLESCFCLIPLNGTFNEFVDTCTGVHLYNPVSHISSHPLYALPDTYENLQYLTERSSHRRCSVKNSVIKNVVNFTGKHLCWSLF